ncbi:MAG: sigma-70 family RNA polymerase sigma factor [Fimbriimonadaceae bacterium]
MQSAQAGDTVAMELVADRYRSQVRGHALRMLRDQEDAEDAVQETFVKAFRAIGTFEHGRPLLPWLMRICSNCCVDIIRGRRQGQECLDKHEHAIFDVRSDVASGVESRLRVESVREAVSRLPERYRRIIEMRHYGHMDVNEIAKALKVPEGTIKSWLFRARALLRKDLQVALG